MAAAITLLCGLVYAVVQQDIRSGANDPQIQIAQDVAALLDSGADPKSIISSRKIDIAKSLATYLIIFDDSGVPIASSAYLDGQIPPVPGGVFDYVRSRGEDRFTWQPRPDARGAVVVARYNGEKPGFVLAGRSLREVEKREAKLVLEVGLGWAFTLFATFVATAIMAILPTIGKKTSRR